MTNSKSIGNSYERYVAKLLSKWITGSDEKLVCWRNVHSGTVGTVRKKSGKSDENVAGDFQCLDLAYDEFFKKFHIDSKSLGDINIFVINPKNQKSNQLLNEWKKVVDDAGENIPLMLVKCRKNRKIPDFIILPVTMKFEGKNIMGFWLEDMGKYEGTIITQEEFFRLNTWETLLGKN